MTFDDPALVADAGLVVPATLMVRLSLEALVNSKVRLVDRVGGSRPGRKVLTLVTSILAGGSHIDHAERLRLDRFKIPGQSGPCRVRRDQWSRQ